MTGKFPPTIAPPPVAPPPPRTVSPPPIAPQPPGVSNRDERGRFKPGHRLKGRPQGSRNKATELLETMLEDGAEEIGQSVLKAIRRGDSGAMRIALDRLYPVRRGAPVVIPGFPKIESVDDVPKAHAAIIAAVAAGVLSPDEVKSISDLLQNFVDAVDALEFKARLDEIERQIAETKQHGAS